MAQNDAKREGVALALSGGGYRATLFHIGSLWRLNELGWLPKIVRLCSVSGGSITAGWLGYKWRDLTFNASGAATNFHTEIVEPLRKLCGTTIDIGVTIKGVLNPFKTAGDYLAVTYEKVLFEKKNPTLQNLPSADKGPEFILYGTNYQSGVSVRFTRQYISDYRIGSIPDPRIPLATAIAVSSAFPPLFSPIVLKTESENWRKTQYADLFDNPLYRQQLYLADGGVYDNLGIEAIWKRYATVLVSDAGGPLNPDPKPRWVTFSSAKEMLRVLGVAVEQQRALRKRWLIDDFKRGEQHGTYWGITTRINDYKLPNAMTHDTSTSGSLKSIRTRLNKFSTEEQGRLINWGYALTDAAMRKHILGPSVPPGNWPAPEFPL
jgi:NTE family protein